MMAFVDTMLITLLPSYIVSYLFPHKSIVEIIGSEAVSFILACFVGILDAGLALIFLKLCAGQPATIADLFYGFRNGRNHCLFISFVSVVIVEVCTLPHTIISNYNAINGINDMMGESSVLLIGTLVATILSIPISQSFYIIVDFPDYTGKEALLQSIKLMKGNIGRYLLFLLSFLPLILISILSFGVGLLWVTPYMHAAAACFYLDLTRSKQ